MMEDELIKIWQSSPNQERVKFEKSRLMLDMQSSMDRLHRSIKYRDLREYIAIVIIIPAFAFSAYFIPFLLTKIASVLIIGYAVFVGLKLRNAKKTKPSAFTEPYLEYLYKTRAYLLVQKQLLDSVLYWYILPGATLTMMFLLGFGLVDRSKQIIKMALINIGLAVATYYLNKSAVQKELVPRITKIGELIRVLEKG
jgi:hypothetical protein